MKWAYLFNYIFSICCLIVVIVLPFLMLFFYFIRYKKFSDDEWCHSFLLKCGTIYGDLKTNRNLLPKVAMMFLYVFFLFRRFFLALVIVFLAHMPGLQIILMLLTCVIAVAYISTYKPFSSPLHNMLHIVNEVTLIILLEGMWLYNYTIYDPYARWGFGFGIITIACLNLLIHLSFLVAENVLLVIPRSLIIQKQNRKQ